MGATGDVSTRAMFPADAKIYIEQKGSDTVQDITTRVTNFSEGGGSKETESVAHFGDAYLTIVKPQEDFEVSFDIDVTDTRFFQTISDDTTVVAGSIAGSTIMVKSGGTQKNYKIKLEFKDDAGSDAFKMLYYNARAVTFEKDNAADDYLKGTLSFKLSPADADGDGQKVEIETSALYDSVAGSPAGSYVELEKTLDSSFGYGVGSMA